MAKLLFLLAFPGKWVTIVMMDGHRHGPTTLNIIDWCKENGNPKPTWEVRAESVVTTFLPSSFFA